MSIDILNKTHNVIGSVVTEEAIILIAESNRQSMVEIITIKRDTGKVTNMFMSVKEAKQKNYMK